MCIFSIHIHASLCHANIRIHRLCRDSIKSADFPGKCIDNILRRIDCNADDMHIPLTVWQTHPSDNIRAVFMQKFI